MSLAELRDTLSLSVFPDDLFAENCFILRRRDTRRCLVIDPGLQVAQVAAVIQQEALEVERILLTHGHIDHIAGVSIVKQRTGAPIAMHPDDLAILNWDHFAELPFIPEGFAPFTIDAQLAHQMTIPFQDMTLTVLHTPGHTQGSVCYLVNLDCFAGDTLFQRGIGRTDLPGGDTAKLVFSIRNVLYRLPPKTVVYPGHGPKTTIEEEKLLNPFVPA